MPEVPQYKAPKLEPPKDTAICSFRFGAPAATCFYCGFRCTRNFQYIDVKSEDGNEMRVPIHDSCYKRATQGGKAVYPERLHKEII